MKLQKSVPFQSKLEERFNAYSHGIAALFALIAFQLMVSSSENNHLSLLSALIYGCALVVMYLASTLLHSVTNPKLKHLFKIIDHISIYLLIAGTYTPVTLLGMHDLLGDIILGVIWAIALFGITLKIMCIDRFKNLSLMLYSIMGWLILVGIKPILDHMGITGTVWLTAGALTYFAGITFYKMSNKYHFSHFIWHLMVIIGSVFQFVAIFAYLIH